VEPKVFISFTVLLQPKSENWGTFLGPTIGKVGLSMRSTGPAQQTDIVTAV